MAWSLNVMISSNSLVISKSGKSVTTDGIDPVINTHDDSTCGKTNIITV